MPEDSTPKPSVQTPQIKKISKTVWLLVFVIAVLLIIIVVGWFFFNKSGEDKSAQKPTTPQQATSAAQIATPAAKKTEPIPTKSYCEDEKEINYQDKFKSCLPKEYTYSQYRSDTLWVEYSTGPVDTTKFIPNGNFVVQLSDKSYTDEVAELSQCCTVTSEKNITVDGVTAVQQLGLMPDNSKIIKTMLFKAGQTYALFYIGTSDADFNTKRIIYDKFVSSFKVL